MVAMSGLGVRALERFLGILVSRRARGRKIELEREREREIAQAKKTAAALGAFLGRVRSIS